MEQENIGHIEVQEEEGYHRFHWSGDKLVAVDFDFVSTLDIAYTPGEEFVVVGPFTLRKVELVTKYGRHSQWLCEIISVTAYIGKDWQCG